MLGKRIKGSCEGTSCLPNWTLERENLECFNRGKWLENVWNMETSSVMCCRPSVFFLTCVFKNKVNPKQQIRLELHLDLWLSLRLERFPVWHFQPQMCVWQMNSQRLNTRPGKSQTSRYRNFFIMEVFVFTCWAFEYLKAQQIRHQYQICWCFPGSYMMIATMHWLSLSPYNVKSIFYNLIYWYRKCEQCWSKGRVQQVADRIDVQSLNCSSLHKDAVVRLFSRCFTMW